MNKLLTRQQLLDWRATQKGKATIVATNGCFDILHVGHLRYLQSCKALGDYLVVLVNTDASVSCLKGPNRPIVPEAERAELLAGLACVDKLCLFNEESPVELLEALVPDIYAKGAQYTPENLPEMPMLQRIGTQVHFVPMVEGRSTSNLIERILRG